ncbi:MAG: hypothetical protein MJY47_02745 [Fibrobacter sp.]|nr:hypothetical protein [Fibrobacter sp.]
MKHFVCNLLLLCLILVGCGTEPEKADFTAEELKALTPIERFRGNPIPEKCFTDSTETFNDYEPYYRIYCHFYFEHYGELYNAVSKMGWKYDDEEGDRGDCGPKREFTKTVDHRKLRLYIKTCEYDGWFVKDDRFYFWVNYD